MMARCYDEANPRFARYGARGIKVCPEWWHFRNLVRDMGERPHEGLTLDRIENDLGYFKANCRWADRSVQNLNRGMFSNNTSGVTGVVEIDGRYEARIDFGGVRYRLGRFASIAEAAEVREVAERDLWEGITPAVGETVWSTSTTKIRGVTAHKDGGYIARATINGVRTYLGYFKTIEEAADAKRRAN